MNILPQQLQALIEDCTHPLSILSNTSALLNDTLEDVSWTGFYLFENNELILGPFQGKVACTNIPIGKGVCGNAAKDLKTYVIDNVHEFPGHIACDSASNSEIVIPLIVKDKLYGVLDIDSTSLHRFTKEDQTLLETCMSILCTRLTQF